MKVTTRRRGETGTRRATGSVLPTFRCISGSPGLHVPFCFVLLACAFALSLNFAGDPSRAQSRRSGAHSSALRESFTPADRKLVERAVGATCAERVRDPLGSTPIDEMQTRPSLNATNPNAAAGARRAEHLLPEARKLVARAILTLAQDYEIYRSSAGRFRTNAAIARVQAVRRIKPDVDARDNAAVLLREPHTIEFGTIFLAGLRSDEGMISVLGHELTHVADGQADSLHPLFRAIAQRAAARTGLRITGQRAEELVCDLVGVMAAREYIKEHVSWEPLPQRLARAVEHNCVDDDASDADHLSPRNTIRALFALDLNFAGEIVGGDNIGVLKVTTQSGSCFDRRKAKHAWRLKVKKEHQVVPLVECWTESIQSACEAGEGIKPRA